MVYYMKKIWEVTFTNKAEKQVKKLPPKQYVNLVALIKELELIGPILPQWSNYSKLRDNLYHCHLSYKWVACWKVEDKKLKLIELYYVGSRENAPY